MTVLDRRSFLSGLSSVAVAGAAGIRPGPAIAATATHGFRLGAMEITIVSDGTLSLGRSFALPRTPPEEAERLLREHGLPADAFQAQTNVVLVRSAGDLVLIDPGSGASFQDTAGKLVANLEAAGIAPAAVTKVILTHAHADHLWGAIDEFDNSPRYANAACVVAPAEWAYWTDRDTVGKLPEGLQGMAAGSARILKALEGRVERRRPAEAVLPGVTLVDTAGHTPGHVSILLESGGERLLVGGDVLTHPVVSFARPDWPWGTDSDAERAAAARRRTLDMLATDRIPLLGYHLPWPGLGRVERKDAAFRFVAA